MKKEIRIDELRVMMLDALTLRGIGSEDAAFIVDDFLDAELEGHKTHGVSKFLTLDIGLSGRESGIEIVRQPAATPRSTATASSATSPRGRLPRSA